MNREQFAAFNGSMVATAADANALFAAMPAVLILIFAGWMMMRTMRGIMKGEENVLALAWTGLRVSVLIWITLYIITF